MEVALTTTRSTIKRFSPQQVPSNCSQPPDSVANVTPADSFSGTVRLVHFGNRSQSLEQLGGPSNLVLRSATDAMDEDEKHRVKEALCYLAPEQTGSVETIVRRIPPALLSTYAAE